MAWQAARVLGVIIDVLVVGNPAASSAGRGWPSRVGGCWGSGLLVGAVWGTRRGCVWGVSWPAAGGGSWRLRGLPEIPSWPRCLAGGCAGCLAGLWYEWPVLVGGVATGDRFRGCLLGLAAGDALGTALEFERPGAFEPIGDMVGGGPFGLEPGQWTDDTSMALCLAESLIESGGFDATDQMRCYLRWRGAGLPAL